MRPSLISAFIVVFGIGLFSPIAYANDLFNFSKSTPVGSWSVREDLVTDHKGKQTVTVFKQSLVGEETVGGEKYYWVEMEIQAYKIKKDKRKKRGDKSIMKVQIDQDLFNADPGNAVMNMNKYAREMIIQNGNGDPIKIEQGGTMAQAAMSAVNVSVEYDFSEKGNSQKDVPAGNFACKLVSGTGSVETKVVIKKMKVTSETESCFSSEVPFGLVHAEAHMVTNGKKSNSVTQLIEFGKSGAKSAITKEPVEMPKMPKLF